MPASLIATGSCSSLASSWRTTCAPTPADVLAGFMLTGHFLERDVLAPQGLALPAARERLIALLARLEPHPEEAL